MLSRKGTSGDKKRARIRSGSEAYEIAEGHGEDDDDDDDAEESDNDEETRIQGMAIDEPAFLTTRVAVLRAMDEIRDESVFIFFVCLLLSIYSTLITPLPFTSVQSS